MIRDAMIFAIACMAIGGLLMLLAAMAAHATGWGMAEEPAAAMGSEPTPCRPVESGRFTCSCRHEMRDDGRGEWDSVTFEDVVDERCPIHGPAGRGWEWIEVTTTADEGRVACIRRGRLSPARRSARSARCS